MPRVPISEEQAQQMLAKQQAQQERVEASLEQKENMLRAFVSAEGRERLKRIEQVKAERAHAVEVYIIQAVQQGKLQPPVTDEMVREILAKTSGNETETKSHITIVRKRMDDDCIIFDMPKRQRPLEPIDILRARGAAETTTTTATSSLQAHEQAKRQRGRAHALDALPSTSDDEDDSNDSNDNAVGNGEATMYATRDSGDAALRHSDDDEDKDAVTSSDDDDDAVSSANDDDGNVGDDDDEDDDADDDVNMNNNDDDEDDDEDEDDEDDDDDRDSNNEQGTVTVDFGVYDLRTSNVNAIMHLLDQLCPDHYNEVDRDALAAVLTASPYSSVVRVSNGDDDDDDDDQNTAAQDDEDDEDDIYGLVSVLDMAHGVRTRNVALVALHKLLAEHVWRTAATGLSPVDVLMSTTTTARGSGAASGDKGNDSDAAKCVLLVSEYIRSVPLELTVQILNDTVTRLGNDAQQQQQQQCGDKHAMRQRNNNNNKRDKGDDDGAAAAAAAAVHVTYPCMYAVLAKVQRAVDPPNSPPPSKRAQQQQQQRMNDDDDEAKDATAAAEAHDGSSDKRKGKKTSASSQPHTMAAATAVTGGQLDMRRYIFWHEEGSVLYEFRDKRVATLVYACRPQYDGQPKQDVPLSVLFVLQHGAMRQAIDEMRKRATAHADVVRLAP